MKKSLLLAVVGSALVLCLIIIGLVTARGVAPEPSELVFHPVTQTEEGKPAYYLFDDNPEHLTSDYLADGTVPSSIAHFGELGPGVYTVFSYHHRADSVPRDADLFFDGAFYTETGAQVQINHIGLDNSWQWNQAWADFTGTDVLLPEYIKSFDCTCPEKVCAQPDGVCPMADEGCSCTIRNERVTADGERFGPVGRPHTLQANTPLLLSEHMAGISQLEKNKFRYGGYDEPMWLMMEFEVLAGELSFDTIAYTNKEAARGNILAMERGVFHQEPQYKGIAKNAPIVKAELSYTINDRTRPGGLPVSIRNQQYPNGIVAKDGCFATNVNTWKEASMATAVSAESDLMKLEYRDASKPTLYGSSVAERDNIWRFDPFHTKLYSEEGNPNFVPNAPMSTVDYPTGSEPTPPSFYQTYACNLGNFGVRYQYTIHLTNSGTKPRTFSFAMKSVSGQVYRFSMVDARGNVVRDDGGQYLMKRFDLDPAEDPNSTTDPKERLEPSKYTTSERFQLQPGRSYTVNLELVTLTGCNAPIENTLRIE